MIALVLLLCTANAPLAGDDATTSPPPSTPPSAPTPSDAAPAPAPVPATPPSPAPASSPDVDITTAPSSPPTSATAPASPTTTVPAATAPPPSTTQTAVAREYPGVIGWTGIAISASGLVVASAAGTYAAVMNGIEGDPTSTRDDKQLAFDTHGVAGTIALAGLGATTIGALVFAADFASPQ